VRRPSGRAPWAALCAPGEKKKLTEKPNPTQQAMSMGLGGKHVAGAVARLASSSALAAMETCTSTSLLLKSQTKPQNKGK